MKKIRIKKASLLKNLNILDIVKTTIEKLMTILVPDCSWADYLLEYSTNSNIFFEFYVIIFNKLNPGGGGGTLFFSIYVGSGPASTLNPPKISGISKKYLKY